MCFLCLLSNLVVYLINLDLPLLLGPKLLLEDDENEAGYNLMDATFCLSFGMVKRQSHCSYTARLISKMEIV